MQKGSFMVSVTIPLRAVTSVKKKKNSNELKELERHQEPSNN